MPPAPESKRALLFVDLLGSKAIWLREGPVAAATAFAEFADDVERALIRLGSSEVISAQVESDAAAILCSSAVIATEVGIELYHEAFFERLVREGRVVRRWMRGVVVAAGGVHDMASLRAEEDRALATNLNVVTLSPILLNAVSMEKSGFRGMRILVDGGLLSPRDRAVLRDFLGCHPVMPVRGLNYSEYPERAERFDDALWMATGDEELQGRRRRRMATRMRLAARDPEEILQAAATQVVFDEYGESLPLRYETVRDERVAWPNSLALCYHAKLDARLGIRREFMDTESGVTWIRLEKARGLSKPHRMTFLVIRSASPRRDIRKMLR